MAVVGVGGFTQRAASVLPVPLSNTHQPPSHRAVLALHICLQRKVARFDKGRVVCVRLWGRQQHSGGKGGVVGFVAPRHVISSAVQSGAHAARGMRPICVAQATRACMRASLARRTSAGVKPDGVAGGRLLALALLLAPGTANWVTVCGIALLKL